MKRIAIDSLGMPELQDYTSLTDVALRRVREPAEGLYLAESLKVIERAVAAGHRVRSVLTQESWVPGLADLFAAHEVDAPLYVGTEEQLERLTGFHMHRGALASMHRPEPRDPVDILRTSRRVVVLEDLADHTNVGAIFRSIAALGADAVLLTKGCADPLYRRSVRVSMGSVLQIPWARLPHWQEAGPLFRREGYELAAFALDDRAEELGSFAATAPDRLALLFGTEGNGLSRQALASAARTVRITMDHGVDSLNVATTAAVALWAVRNAEHAVSASEHAVGAPDHSRPGAAC